MSRVVVCLDCPHYQKGGWCRIKKRDVGALHEACDKASEPAEATPDTDTPTLQTTKKCRKCRQELPLSAFLWTTTNKGEKILMRMCSACYHESMSKNGKKKKTENMNNTTEAKTKRCSKCGEVKPLDEFYKDDASSDSYKSQCKTCHIATVTSRNRERRAAKRDERLQEVQAIETAQKKTCPRCGRELPAEAFGKHARTRDGLQPYCRECRSTAQTQAKPTPTPPVVVREVLTDAQMVEALRAHGWEVTCTRTITETL